MFPTHFPFMRDAMGLRAALLPHLYTAARLFYDTAVAPVRALYIDFPQEALAYSQRHTYMFGDILVSPIHTFSVDGLSSVSVSVWLPKGHWAPWSGTDPVIVSTGLGYFTRDYGQSEIPIFVRADALLPLALHGAADIVETSPDIAWTVWDAGAQYGGGSLYEDDGFSQRYRGGALTPPWLQRLTSPGVQQTSPSGWTPPKEPMLARPRAGRMPSMSEAGEGHASHLQPFFSMACP